MFKPGIPVFIVDTILEATRYYTEKLGFDIDELMQTNQGVRRLTYVQFKKGKCRIIFREPFEDEQVEYSQVKHCLGRGSGVFIELKKNLDVLALKYEKRKVNITEKPADRPWGYRSFSIKDPFGIRLTFGLELENYKPDITHFLGFTIDWSKDPQVLHELFAQHLAAIGLRRRACKKYSKLWLKKALDVRKRR